MKRKLIAVIILTSIFIQTPGIVKAEPATTVNTEVKVKESVQKVNLKTIMGVDTPINNSVHKDSLSITGWALDSIAIKQVEIYIDNKLIGTTKTGLDRPDVDEVFPGYPKGKQGGFNYAIDINKFSEGDHKLKVKAIGESGGVFEENKTFKIKKLPPLINTDLPAANSTVKGDSFVIEGWALNTSGVKLVRFYINDNLVSEKAPNVDRPDVIKVFTDYNKVDTLMGYKHEISASKLKEGSNKITVEVIGNDGAKVKENRNININKKTTTLVNAVNIDSPSNNFTINGDKFILKGWTLQSSGIKTINVYSNGKLITSSKANKKRPDVVEIFPGYPDGENNGYEFSINASQLSAGSNELIVESVGNNGNIAREKIKVRKNVATLVNAVSIDSPTNNLTIKEDKFTLKGWTLQSSGIKTINVYNNGKLIVSSKANKERPDVVEIFPGYPDGKNNGYEFSVNASQLTAGSNELVVESIGNNGDIAREKVKVNYKTAEANLIMGTNIDKPVTDFNAASGTFDFTGWVLHPKGISTINLYVNNKKVWSGKPNVVRPDVVKVFPGYPDGSDTGYSFKVTSSMLRPGSNTLKVEVVGNDGTKKSEERRVNYGILKSEMSLDAPTKYFYTDKDNSLTVQGWALHNSKIKEIQVLVDGKVVYKGTLNQERPDVKSAYPKYSEGLMSGFYYSIPLGSVASGTHTLKVNAISDTGEVQSRSTQFYKANSKLIVIDPGHGGSDPGAIGVHGGISYKESYYNLMLSLKVKEKLEAYGFSVVMTRNSEGETVGLQDRSVIANNLGPIFFLSIHHDAFNRLAKGSSTHYSTYRPNVDSSGLYVRDGVIFDGTPSVPAAQSENVAKSLATAISSVGFENRGYKDHNLSVTRNTNMPSVLAECGFIDSAADIRIINDALKRDMLAQKIASTINSYYGK